MPKINQEEYEVLKGLDDKWEWIARDEAQQTYAYEYRPIKSKLRGQWESNWNDYYLLPHDWLQFIQWEDEEPYNIAELIEEYEKDYKGSWEHAIEFSGEVFGESEETEVKKNIEWLKSAIQQNLDFYNDNDEEWQMAKVRAYAKSLDLINQLDEPEVLSQELPVIPKFVADWISAIKPDNSLRVAFEHIAQRKKDYYDDELAFWIEEGNSETFARAWMDGYTVEVPKRYRIKVGNIYMLNNSKYTHKKEEAFTYAEDGLGKAEADAKIVGGVVEELEE